MLDKQETCLDCDGITINTILLNLIEERTLRKDTLMNIFSYHFKMVFCKIPILIDKISPRIPTKREDDWIQTLKTKASLWTLKLKVVTELCSYKKSLQLY